MGEKGIMRTVPACLFVAAMLAGVHDASAQDVRWAPWLGCWERVTERVDDASVDGSGRTSVEPDPAATGTGTAPRVCVERDGENAVRLTTTVPGQEPIEQMLIADGEPHPISEGGCQGTETIEWSRTGQRLFARAEVDCAGAGARAVSGLALITPDDTWLDIRSVRIGDISSTRVSRYSRIDLQPSPRIPRVGSTPLTVEELKEAAGQVTDAVLEAVLVETNPRLPVRSDTLLDLADAGVSPGVLDLIVALAYPDRFVVERTGQIATVTESGSRRPGIDDYYYSGFYHPAYYYSPFGYSYIGYYDPFLFGPAYYGYPTRGGGRPGLPGRITPSRTGRAIDGQGYTRIRPAEEARSQPRVAARRAPGTQSAGQSSGSSGTVSSSGSSGGGTSSGGGSSSSGGSSGGGASPEGFTGGGGGGRTAQPR
jgi:hypothetical protein